MLKVREADLALLKEVAEPARSKFQQVCGSTSWVWVGVRVGLGLVRELARQKVPVRCAGPGLGCNAASAGGAGGALRRCEFRAPHLCLGCRAWT